MMIDLLTRQQKARWLTETADLLAAAGPEGFDFRFWLTIPHDDIDLDDYDPLIDSSDADRADTFALLDIAATIRPANVTAKSTACLGGWLMVTAPNKVRISLLDANADVHHTAAAFARLIGVDVGIFTMQSWSDLRRDDPARYGMLDRDRPFDSAVEFLRTLSVEYS